MPDLPPKPTGWPNKRALKALVRAAGSLAVAMARRPDLRDRLAPSFAALWAEMPPAVRGPARAIAVRNAPETSPFLIAGAMLEVNGRTYAGQDQPPAAPSADDTSSLTRAINDWNASLERATERARNLWRAAYVARTAADAAATAASANPESALSAARTRLAEAASFAGWGLGLVVLGVVGVYAFFGRH